MKVLVTGGGGYIGSHTVLTLLNNNIEVVVLDDFSNSNITALKRVEYLTNKKINIIRGDVRDKKILDYIFNTYHFETVIHFAGLKSVSDSVKKPLEYYDVNFNGTLVLLDRMTAHNVKHLVFSSSATVYGTPEKLPLDEECSTGGTTNPYGTSKFFVEELLKSHARASKNFRATILRYFNPIGAHPSGLIGEAPNGTPNNLLPYITNVAIGKLDCLNVFGSDYSTYDGSGVRDYIHVMDLAEGHLSAIKADFHPGVFVFNLGTGKGISVFEIIKEFEKVTGISIAYKISSRRDGDIDEVWSNPFKANKELNWVATRSLKDMITDAWNWQKSNPLGYK